MRPYGKNDKTPEYDSPLLDEILFDSFWVSFGNLPVGIIVIDQKSVIRFFNAMAGYFLGIQPIFSLGKPVEEIMPESHMPEIFITGVALYDKQRLIKGRQLKCNSLPIKVHGRVVSVVELMFDHTEKTSISNQLITLKKKYDFLESILDETFEELGAVDKEGHVTYISRKSAQNLGLPRDEILGRDMSILDKNCYLKKVANTGIPHVGNISRPQKKQVPVIVAPLFEGDNLSGAVCRSIFADMGEAQEFLNRLKKSDPNRNSALYPRPISKCRFSFHDIEGQSKAIQYAKKKALRVAEGDSTILITGESGTGKELFSQAIHMSSLRKKGPFVRVNCAGIPETLLESELFGYETGAFTGAGKNGKPGKFEMAHNGTIFLDEAGDMSMGMQAKLLRVIQENEFERVGGTTTYEVDVRIIAATNRDLWEMVNKGHFREDLYYRLDVVNIRIPTLRERIEDIPLLIEHFIPLINRHINSPVKGVARDVLNLFLEHNWPGNVRELHNVLEGAMNLNTDSLLNMQSLPSRIRRRMGSRPLSKPMNLSGEVASFRDRKTLEKAMIEQALIVKNGNKRQAAIYLNMCRSTFYNKLKEYNIEIQPGHDSQHPPPSF
ncbi:MAG: sigma 54-interacting transcriptional regulator [Syntrophaceae bacterium]|nr:sigma 54-interacting transcriptional regulator [Syntrophaceae bacterium]